MTTEARTKPDYLGLLNGISIAERNAGIYLKAWADVTPDPELKAALSLVAARETTHGEVFRQRIERLGFTLRDREDPALADRLRVYGDPNCPDVEKIRYGRRGDDGDSAVNSFFASIDEKVNDESVDPLTRDTLRWYVHEERDSGALLREVYARVEARAGASPSNGTTSTATATMPSGDAQAIIACMSEGFAALQRSIKELSDALAKRRG